MGWVRVCRPPTPGGERFSLGAGSAGQLGSAGGLPGPSSCSAGPGVTNSAPPSSAPLLCRPVTLLGALADLGWGSDRALSGQGAARDAVLWRTPRMTALRPPQCGSAPASGPAVGSSVNWLPAQWSRLLPLKRSREDITCQMHPFSLENKSLSAAVPLTTENSSCVTFRDPNKETLPPRKIDHQRKLASSCYHLTFEPSCFHLQADSIV